MLTEQTRLLRTSVELDKSKEPRNLAYIEGAGRLYKQLLQLFKSYKVIGLNTDEAFEGIRRVCINSIVPIRLKILEYLVHNNNGWETTSSIANGVKLGKGWSKGQLTSLHSLGIVDYREFYDEVQRRMVDNWLLIEGGYHLLLNLPPKLEQKSFDYKPPL